MADKPEPPPAPPSVDTAHAHEERTCRQRLSWAQLLARVFLIDVLHCPHCGGRRRIVSFLTDPQVVRRILTHLGMPTEAPVVKPARMLAELGPMLEFGDDVAPVPDDDPWPELGTTEDDRAPP